MAVDLNRMRRAFIGAAAWCGWSEADQTEISAEIRTAVDTGNEEVLAYWAACLEELAGWARLATLCRAAEARIRIQRAAERDRQAA